jgi:hypothetical protein
MWLKWIRKGPGTLAWAEPCAAAHLACKSLSGTCLHINGCYSPNLMELFSLCNIHSTQLSISKEPLQYTNTRQRHSFCFRLLSGFVLFCLGSIVSLSLPATLKTVVEHHLTTKDLTTLFTTLLSLPLLCTPPSLQRAY